MLVRILNSRDRHENIWLPKNASRAQPDNHKPIQRG